MNKMKFVFFVYFCVAICGGVLYGGGKRLSIKSFKIDGKIRNSELSPVKLIKVFPEKLFFYSWLPVRGEIEIFNNGKKEEKVRLVVWLTNDLDKVAGKKERLVVLRPGELKKLSFVWAADILHPYGHAMKVKAVQNGKTVCFGEEYFTTADNVLSVAISGAHPIGFTAEVKNKKQIEDAVFYRFRKCYVNTFEKFFWAPDDFADMTPDKDVWFSGQARYHESKKNLRYMNEYGRKIGVMPMTYGKSIGSGDAARNIIRKNPEMIWGYGGVMDFHPDTEELAKWQEDSKPYWQGTGWANYNMNQDSSWSSVIWEDYVKEYEIDKNHKRLIVHLINRPLQDTATESYALSRELRRRRIERRKIVREARKKKKKPDFSKIDKLPSIKLHPDHQKNINVKIVYPELPSLNSRGGTTLPIQKTTAVIL